MARHEHLPIYQVALDMTEHFENVVASFSRYHKHTLGTELREGRTGVSRPMNKPYFVRAEWDAEAAVWVAASDDVPGLVTEAETQTLRYEPQGKSLPSAIRATDSWQRLPVEWGRSPPSAARTEAARCAESRWPGGCARCDDGCARTTALFGRECRFLAGTARSRPRQQSDIRCNSPAGQGQLSVGIGNARSRPEVDLHVIALKVSGA
jgi:hypothetical protein